MKLFGVLLLVFSMLNGGEHTCPHALNAHAANDACHEMPDGPTGHDHHTGMSTHRGDHGPDEPGSSDPHCPDNCEGGQDCTGCTALAATIPASTVELTNPIHGGTFSGAIKRAVAIPSVFDPPPPKSPSLI